MRSGGFSDEWRRGLEARGHVVKCASTRLAAAHANRKRENSLSRAIKKEGRTGQVLGERTARIIRFEHRIKKT